MKFVASYCNEFADGFAAGFTDILRVISRQQLNFQAATYVEKQKHALLILIGMRVTFETTL